MSTTSVVERVPVDAARFIQFFPSSARLLSAVEELSVLEESVRDTPELVEAKNALRVSLPSMNR